MQRPAAAGGGREGSRLKGAIKKFFLIEERNTTIGTELRAGVVTFLTMSYILLVNPQILSQMGLPASDVVVATAVASGTASLTCGLFGNLPFGLAPGTGLSAYLSYGLVMSGVLTLSQAMTACLISGAAMGLSALIGLSTVIMAVIPRSVKLATVVGMGLLIALIGMVSVKLVVPNTDTLVALGDFSDYHIWLALVGLVLTGTLLFHQVKGGVLIGIILVTVVVWVVDGSAPTKVAELPQLHYGVWKNIDFSSYNVQMVPAIMAFLFVGIFDLSGVIHGLASLAKLVDGHDPHGHAPGSLWAFLSSSIGTVVAAMAGCSPVIIHVESAAGIRGGGRTGLTAVTVGLLFFLSVFLAPLFTKVPNAATAPILILVGAMMISESQHIDWLDMSQAIPAFLTCMMMPFTFSIPNGILFGIGMSAAFFITTGEFLNYLPLCRKGKRGDDGRFPDAYTINGNAPPDEHTHLHDGGGFPPRTPSFFDDKPLTKRLSLILPKDEADALEHDTSPLELNGSGQGGGAGATSYGGHLTSPPFASVI